MALEGLALDPPITSLRHCVRHRGLTRRRAVVERRHCQQAASNDARVLTGVVLVLGVMLIGMHAWRSISSARRRCAERSNCAESRSGGVQSPQVKPRDDESQGAGAPVHWGPTNARPLGVTQSDSGSDVLERRVTTATPFCSPMELGKEPPQRSFELTPAEQDRQEVRHANAGVLSVVSGGGCAGWLPDTWAAASCLWLRWSAIHRVRPLRPQAVVHGRMVMGGTRPCQTRIQIRCQKADRHWLGSG